MRFNLNATNVQPAIKESDQLKALIVENRSKIAALRQQIAELSQKRGAAQSLQIQNQIVSRHHAIKALETSTERLQDRLAKILPLEAVAERLQAQAAQEQATQEREANAAQLAAVKAIALAEWLRVPGQTAQGFTAAWPGIATRIATDAATVAATDLHAQTQHAVNGTARIAADVLAAKYGLPGAKGHQAGAVTRQILAPK